MDTDFLVVGGGIAGVSVGAALASLGSVTLWEAEDVLGYHASGRSAAMFEESYGPPPVLALNSASRPDHERLGDLTERGFLAVGGAGEEDAFQRDRDGMGLTEISVAEARDFIPILSDRVTHAAYHGDAFDLETDAMQQRAVRAIRSAGGDVQTGRPVTALIPEGAGWRAVSGTHSCHARMVFNAAGAWADRVAACAGIAPIGLRPLRRSMARIAAPTGQDVARWPMLMGAGETWYAKPDAGALIVSPADQTLSDPMDAHADDMDLAEGLDRYERTVTAPLTRPMANWAGLRTFAPDGALVLGPSTAAGVWWVAGQGGYGFQTAPAAARLVADRVAGRASELGSAVVAALDPGRFP